jgi:hypothetical protein
MPSRRAIGATVVIALFGVMFPRSGLQTPAVRVVDEKALREYTGVPLGIHRVGVSPDVE